MKEKNTLPQYWDHEKHTIDDEFSDFGLINFIDTKGKRAKVLNCTRICFIYIKMLNFFQISLYE